MYPRAHAWHGPARANERLVACLRLIITISLLSSVRPLALILHVYTYSPPSESDQKTFLSRGPKEVLENMAKSGFDITSKALHLLIITVFHCILPAVLKLISI